MAECLPVDAVAIAEEIGRGGVVRERVDEQLGGPRGSRMLGHIEVEDAPAVVGEHDEDEEDAQARGGQREEVESDEVAETVRSATSIPSLRSSPWIRGAPRRGFAAAIFLTRAVISTLMGGRPPAGRPESFVQCSRKRHRTSAEQCRG